MGFGTVFTMMTLLLVFAGMIVLLITVHTSITESSNFLKQQQAKQLRAQEENIDITSLSKTNPSAIAWEIKYADQWNKGNFTNTTLIGDTIQLQNTKTQGKYISEPLNIGHTSNFTTISFNSIIPSNTTVGFQIRTAKDLTTLLSENFIGPDGTTNTYYNITGTSINETHSNSSYIQFQITLTSEQAGTTPTIYSTSIGIVRGVDHIKISLKNTGSEKLHFEATDIYVNGIRIPRTFSNRVLKTQNIIEPRLWNPGEELNITVFSNQTGSINVVAVNDYAKDSEVAIV